MENWRKCRVLSQHTIFEVMGIIDKSALQLAMVVDEKDKLLGIVTDGDIRRAILTKHSLEDPISLIMNANPITVNEKMERHLIINRMKQRELSQVPVVNDEGLASGLISLKELAYKRQRENAVILMVGGLGTRLRPLTDNCPKPLLKVGHKPILETIVENFVEEGFHRFYFAVNYKSNMIQNYFGDGSQFGVEIHYMHESKRMGTAGALSLLPGQLQMPAIVMNGDLLTKVDFGQLLDYHEKQQALATMAVREYNYTIPYGVVKFDSNKIVDIEEKPTQSFFVNAGIYVLNPEIVDRVRTDAYMDMTDLFNEVIAEGEKTAAYPIREYWIDIGKMDDFEKAQKEYVENF